MDLAGALGKISQMLAKQVIDATADWIKFEHTAFTTLRTVGYTGEQLTGINRRLIHETRTMAKAYGVTNEELAKFQRRFNEVTKSAAIMNSETKEQTVAMAKLLGEDKVFAWAESMQKFGMHVKAANAWLGKGQIEAKALGLNAEQFASEMAKSVSLMNRMNFKTGIGGLEKMVGLAMRLGTSVETLTKHADIDNGAFSDIEKSIETAASLQRLGGSFAMGFSNPMEVMAEGMFDAESAAERVAKMLEGKGTFNRATGQVDMNWYDKKSIGVAAQAMGVSPDEYRTIANRQVMGGAIDQDLKKSGQYGRFSEQERDAIKNLAQFNPDKQTFEINYVDEDGNEKTTSVKDLSPEELAKAIQLTDKEKDINKNVTSIAGHVKTIADVMQGKAKDVTSAREVIEGSKESARAYRAEKADDFLNIGDLVGWGKRAIQGASDFVNWGLNQIIGHADGGIIQSSPTGLEGVQKFADGGLVRGGSWQGDRVLTRLNSGEMVLNKSQQAQLFNIANGQQNDNSVGNFGLRQAVFTRFSDSVTKAGELIQKSSSVVDKAAKVVPTNLKGLKQMYKLAKSAAVINYIPTRALSNNNLAARFVRSKVHKMNPAIDRVWEGATNTADKVRNLPKTAWNLAKNSDAGINAYIAKEELLDRTVRPLAKKTTSIKDTVHYGILEGGKRIKESRLGKAVTSAKDTAVLKAWYAKDAAKTKIGAIGKAVASKGRGLAVGTIMQMQQTKVGQTMLTAADKLSSGVSKLGSHIKEFSQGVAKTSKTIGNLASSSAKMVGNFGKTMVSTAANWGKTAAKTAINKVGGGVSKVGKGLSKVSNKVGSSLVRGTAKVLGKTAAKGLRAAGPVGTAISAGFSVYEGFSAIKDYSKIKGEIESRGDLSNKEKKQLIEQAQNDRNEKVGGAAGSVAGGVIGGAVGSLLGPLGTAAGAAIGSFLGEKVGGFIGKSFNGVKKFLFGEKKELSEEDKAQQDYEETKMGQVGIDDPQLQEKAAMATCAMHDLLVSIWHHMNGKMSNGEKKDSGGLFGKIGSGLKSAAKGIIGGAIGIIGAPFKAIGSLFGGKKDEEKEKDKVEGKEEETKENKNSIAENVAKINTNLETFLNNASGNTTEGENGKPTLLSTLKQKFAIAGMNSPLSLLKMATPFGLIGAAVNAIKAKAADNETIKPQPLGEEAVKVENKETSSISTNETSNLSDTIKLEVSGTIKLEAAGGNSSAIDMKSLLESPEMKEKILNLVYEGLNRRATGGRMDSNTSRAVLKGANNR